MCSVGAVVAAVADFEAVGFEIVVVAAACVIVDTSRRRRVESSVLRLNSLFADVGTLMSYARGTP